MGIKGRNGRDLKSGATKNIIVSRYKNGNLFRIYCQAINAGIQTGQWDIINTIIPVVVLSSTKEENLVNEDFVGFTPNPFVSAVFYFNLPVIAFIYFLTYDSIKNSTYAATAPFIVVAFLMFLLINSIQRYFLVSREHLIIKTWLRLRPTVIIKVSDIKKIEILRVSRSASLSVMTTDYLVHNFTIDSTTLSSKIEDMVKEVNTSIKK